MFTRAIVRTPANNFSQGMTTAGLGRPDLERMLDQHEKYIDALRGFDLEVTVLPPLRQFPDAHFVEDTAVVTPRIAVIANPGAASRRGEEESIAAALSPYRDVEWIHPPGTLDGGDVLMVENHFFVGISKRTNPEGAAQLCRILEHHGHSCAPVQVADGLHLKSSVNWLGGDTLIVGSAFDAVGAFSGYRKIRVSAEESPACNTLWVNERLLTPAGFPRTQEQLSGLGLPVVTLDMSESQKMDGGLTCLSLRL